MSLILEALKKSERQRQVGTAPTLATPAMTLRAKRSPLPWLIAAIVVAAGAGWWLSRDDAPAPETPSVASAPTPTPAPPPAAESITPPPPMTTIAPPPAAAPASAPAVPAAVVSDEKKVAEAAAAVAAAAPRSDAGIAAAPAAVAPPSVAAPAAAPPRTSPTPTRPMAAAPAAPTTAPAGAPAAAPAVAAPSASAGLPLLWELPYEKRKDMPKLGMSLQVYSADPAGRFAIINDERRKEGDELGDGLVLREITPDGLIIEFQGERFLYPRGGR